MSGPPARPAPRRDALLLVAIFALAALLRFLELGRESLWLDEGYSTRIARLPWPDMLRTAWADVHPPLYSVLLHFWIGAFGAGEWALRSLSAIASLASVALVLRLGEELFDRRTARFAALFVAVSPFQILYAQEARPYAWLAAFTLLWVLALLRWIASARSAWLAVHVLAGAAMVWTHNAAWFAALGAGIWTIVELRRTRRRLLVWLASQLLIVLAALPWLATLGEQLAHVSTYRVPPPTLVALGKVVWGWGGSLAATAGLLGLLVLALVEIVRAHEGRSRALLPAAIAAAGVLVPFLISLAGPSMFVARATLAPALAACLLAARAAAFARPRPLAIALSALLAGGALVRSAALYPELNKERWREAVRDVEASAAPGDLVISCAGYCVPNVWEYYARRSDLEPLRVPRIGDGMDAADRAALERALEGRSRAWLVLSHAGPNEEEVRARLARFGRVAADSLYFCASIELTRWPRWVGIEVARYERER